MPQPKRRRNRFTSWGVSAISGTRTRAFFPAVYRRRDGLEVDLGLAAAGDAVEEKRGEYAPVEGGDDLGAGSRLVLVEDQFLVPVDDLFTERVAVDLPLFPGDEAQFHEPFELRPRFAELPAEFRPGEFNRRGYGAENRQGPCADSRMRLGTGGNPVERLPLDRHPVVRRSLTLVVGAGRVQESGREGGPDHLPQRVEVVGGGPAEEVKFVGRQERFRIEDRADRFQFLR